MMSSWREKFEVAATTQSFPTNNMSHLGWELPGLLLLVPAVLLLGQRPLTVPPLAARDALQLARGKRLEDRVLQAVSVEK